MKHLVLGATLGRAGDNVVDTGKTQDAGKLGWQGWIAMPLALLPVAWWIYFCATFFDWHVSYKWNGIWLMAIMFGGMFVYAVSAMILLVLVSWIGTLFGLPAK